MSGFPIQRLRRLRQNQALRDMLQETLVTPKDLIAPLFIVLGTGVKKPIQSLPGQFHLSADLAAEEALSLYKLGIPAVLLFGLPEHKNATGSSSCDDHGVVQEAIRSIKQAAPELLVIADLCFCEYTDHGHCGVIENNQVDNDKTLIETEKQTLSLARAGVDMIAPSGMMDGVVGCIRNTLDENGFTHISIMGYSAKYASAYYGPFREAVDSTPSFGDRRSYQMNPANGDEALREVELDLEEGADIVMVKPALAYLDVISRIKSTFNAPLAAYNVSGEYSMIKAAAAQGLIDEKTCIEETLTAIKRAGADLIISYHAKEFAEWYQA